jgi:hypothetical protein
MGEQIEQWYYNVKYYLNYIEPIHKEFNIPINDKSQILSEQQQISFLHRMKHEHIDECFIKIQSSTKFSKLIKIK